MNESWMDGRDAVTGDGQEVYSTVSSWRRQAWAQAQASAQAQAQAQVQVQAQAQAQAQTRSARPGNHQLTVQ